MIFLDNNSTTPVDNRVLKKMLPYFSEKYNNPHSQNTKHNRKIIQAVEIARLNIAELINADPREIIFTSGATEANNMAIKGLRTNFLRGKNHYITLNTEHKCILEAIRKMGLEGAKGTILRVNKNGLIDPKEVEKAINKKTVLVSVMMANNETGVLQPIKEIAYICKQKKVLFHTDAAQAAGKIKIDVKKLNVDLLSISAHKFYGPKGIGALYIKRFPRVRINPIIDGGGQEFTLRSGTLPVPLCIGFGEAAKISNRNLYKEAKKTKELRDFFIRKLREKYKNIIINGDIKKRLPANINLSIPNVIAEKLIANLKHTVVSSGSACTSNSIEHSYVLSGMGLDKTIVDSSIRIGIGRFNTKRDIINAIKDIDQTIKLIKKT